MRSTSTFDSSSTQGDPGVVVAFPSQWDAVRLDAVVTYAGLLDASAAELRLLDPKPRLKTLARRGTARRPLARTPSTWQPRSR